MMNKKPSVTMTWLPLIFLTVLNAGTAHAETGGVPPLSIPPLHGNEANIMLPPAENQAMQQQPVQAVAVPTPPVMQQAEPRFQKLLANIVRDYPTYSPNQVLVVDDALQRMFLVENGHAVKTFVISTATNGLGSAKGSQQTPRGMHRIAQKIGDGAPFGTIFKSRQATGQIVNILHEKGADSPDDYVTSRIMWLDGLDEGVNKGGAVDSKDRFIYIHGTGEEGKLGTRASHGCIRMMNQDVIELFNRVNENTLVYITEGSNQP